MNQTKDGRRRGPRDGARAQAAAPESHGDGPEGDAPLPEGRPSFRFGRRQRLYRGAPPDPNIPYIACIGGERSFGRGADAPWPERLGRRLDFQVVNFGVEGAGPGFFLADSGVLDACDGAAHCVMELCGAWNLSNRYYSVGRRYNRRLRGVSDHMRELYHDVRLEEFQLVGKLMDALHAHDPDRFALVEEEARAAWVARTRALLEAIEAPVTLLWFGHRRPSEDLRPDPARPRTLPPEAVTQGMVEAVLPFSAGYAEIVFERPADGGRPRAAPTDAMHERIAEAAQRATAPLLT
ncbi:DUF6473 family protein [Rhodovulum sp. DZ06]|uniref:DUF6473 family protein n=1 Tax=Rhodovulum sp. DZ06 TaxID=3425126 RepID=UPI003D32A641